MQDGSRIEEFLPYMPGVARCERALRELNFAWRLIESTAKMVCPDEAKTLLPTMQSTRDGFNRLEAELITNLVRENITKSVQEIHFKSRVIIDIVVRNLFERTADVGFLAMDDAIREFILDEHRDSALLVPRLREYRDKYTVYDEIVVLDIQGNVLAHLDERNRIERSRDPLIAVTLASDGYVETFRHSDLKPAEERSLIYSRKIADPKTGAAIGVLCLCFPLGVEMEGVFAGLRKQGDRSVMMMLDGDGVVIASSDPDHVAPGRRVPMARSGSYEIISYAGRDYFAKTSSAQDYQGYRGPGWLGHVMIPCESAFRQQSADALSAYDTGTLRGVMSHAKQFCPPLYDVTLQAEAINTALRRVVWNGQIMSTGRDGNLTRLKAILREISQTGDETNRVFRDSIHDLYATVVSSSLQDLQFISRLMIDIMDRNLYERANDCRWWALTPGVRRLLAKGAISHEDRQRITATLEAVNALYTAYSRLVVFDTAGSIVAASDLHGEGLEVVGCAMDPELVKRTLALRGSQKYCVSDFASTWLYRDRPTYIYCAAIFHPDEPSRVVGGIGIVFDSEPEFRNMLQSSLPPRPGAFALYTDRSSHILSSTSPDYPPGGHFALDGVLSGQKNGEGSARIAIRDRQYMMVGATMSFGYREFKNSGDYANDVVAMVFVPIGEETETRAEEAVTGDVPPHLVSEDRKSAGEYATFRIGDGIYGVPIYGVVEAVEARRMVSASPLKPLVAGVLDFNQEGRKSSAFVPVVDMRCLLDTADGQEADGNEIIIVRRGDDLLGLLAGDLLQVLEFSADRIEPASRVVSGRAGYVSHLVNLGDREKMIQLLDLDTIFDRIFRVQKERVSVA